MKKTYLLFIVSLLISGTNGIVASFIALPSSWVVFFRLAIGVLFLLGMFFLTGQRFTFLKNPRHFLLLVFSGLAMGASMLFIFEAYRLIGVSVAELAFYCAPVMVMALSPLLFKERLTVPTIVGFIAVFGGLVLLNGDTLTHGGDRWGLFCSIAAAVLFTTYVILNKKADGIVGLESTLIQLFFALVATIISVAVQQGPSLGEVAWGAAQSWLPIVIIGVGNTGIGCLLYFSAMKKLPVQTSSVFSYLEPLSTVIFSAVLLQETLSPAQFIGGALILGGALFAELVKSRRPISLPTYEIETAKRTGNTLARL